MAYQLQHDPGKSCTLVKKTSYIYGDTFIDDAAPCDEDAPVAWNIRDNRLHPGSAVLFGVARSNEPSIAAPVIYFLNTAVVGQMRIEGCDWRSKKHPFTQADLLDNWDNQIQELIYRIKTSGFIRHRENLANKLFALYNDAKEEDSSCIGMSIDSLNNFYSFLQLNENLKCPIISLTPDYNIYASWRNEEGQLFSVHFLPGVNVRFVLFKLNKMHPETKIRMSGSATSDMLVEIVAPLGVQDWISE